MNTAFEATMRQSFLKHSKAKVEALRKTIHTTQPRRITTMDLASQILSIKENSKTRILFGKMDVTKHLFKSKKYLENKTPEEEAKMLNGILQVLRTSRTGDCIVIHEPPHSFELLAKKVTYDFISSELGWLRTVEYHEVPDVLIFPGIRGLIANELKVSIDADFHQTFNKIALELGAKH